MARDEIPIHVEFSNVAWGERDGPPGQPEIAFRYEESLARVKADLAARVRADLAGGDLDVAARQTARGGGDQVVVSVSDRVTGTYLLETTIPAGRLEDLLAATRAYATHSDGPPRYGVRVATPTAVIAEVTTGLLRIYGPDGTLQRDTSLIPPRLDI